MSCYMRCGLVKSVRWTLPSVFRHVSHKTDVDMNLFQQLGVSTKLCRSLAAVNINIPTVIQHEVLPITLAQTRNCVIQSSTGSGKTLTFLIPALQDSSPGLHSLIVVPSRELAIQIEHQARKLISGGILSKSLVSLYSGGDDLVEVNLKLRPNIMIGTPKRVLEIVCSQTSLFNSLQRIILDEVDKLLPPDSKRRSHHVHIKPTLSILKKLMHGNHDLLNAQCIASSATINEDVIDKLTNNGWGNDFHLISTSQLGSLNLPKSVMHGIIAISTSVDYNKLDILIDCLRWIPGKAMVVIDRNAPISEFVFQLRQKKINAVALHEHTISALEYSDFLQRFESGLLWYIRAYVCMYGIFNKFFCCSFHCKLGGVLL